MGRVWGELDVVTERAWQQSLPVGVLQFHRKSQCVRLPRNRNSETEPDGQTRVTCRKARDPEGVPAPTEHEQLAPNRLDRVGEKSDVDAGAETVRCGIQHDIDTRPIHLSARTVGIVPSGGT
jgi:hypothetical protein